MPFCLFYVSDNDVAPASVDNAIEDIVRCSRARNAALEVTGALIFSGSNFAQFLEGEEEHVRTLMRSIQHDPRHRNVSVLLERHVSETLFSSWSLAYSGPSIYVQSRLTPLLSGEAGNEEAVWEVVRMMRKFAVS